MKDQRTVISAALTSLLALGITVSSGAAYSADDERCFGIAKAGQNACNSNVNQHSCAGHSKIDNDPGDYTPVPQGSCAKLGGKLAPTSKANKSNSSAK